MENQSERAYTQVVVEANRLLGAKQQAVQQWVDAISAQIATWRAAAQRAVDAIDAHSLAHAGTTVQRFFVPIWYVETASTEPTMWPWQRGTMRDGARFIAPMMRDPQGKRMALSNAKTPHMRQVPMLQRRLVLLNDERGQDLQHVARRLGTPVSFNPAQLDRVARATAMPRAMIEALRTERLGLSAPVDKPLVPTVPGDVEDRFFDAGPALPDDAWEEADRGEPLLDDDAWVEEPPSRDERARP
jgi:hypothetical protein